LDGPSPGVFFRGRVPAQLLRDSLKTCLDGMNGLDIPLVLDQI
jgi:hypothetical protein